MEKLYEHVLKKQEAKHKRDLEDLENRMRAEMKNMMGEAAPSVASRIAAPEHKEAKEIKTATVKAGRDAIVDQSTKNITINIFGAEKTPHITPVDVLGLLKGLGRLGDDLSEAGKRLILAMAMMIYSDERHPENITCYMSNKKGKDALVHGESGWEVMPISLTLSPMAARSVDELFKKQPWQGVDGIDADANLEEPTKILSYIAKHEGDLVGGAAAPGSEMRAIPIRNREILGKMLVRLPKMGET